MQHATAVTVRRTQTTSTHSNNAGAAGTARLRLPSAYGGNTLLLSRRRGLGRRRPTGQSLAELVAQARRLAPTAPFDLEAEVRPATRAITSPLLCACP